MTPPSLSEVQLIGTSQGSPVFLTTPRVSLCSPMRCYRQGRVCGRLCPHVPWHRTVGDVIDHVTREQGTHMEHSVVVPSGARELSGTVMPPAETIRVQDQCVDFYVYKVFYHFIFFPQPAEGSSFFFFFLHIGDTVT